MFVHLQGVRIYSVQCLGKPHADEFYQSLAQLTQGRHIPLDNFVLVTDIIIAVCYTEHLGIRRVKKEEWTINVKMITGKMRSLSVMSDSKVLDLKVRKWNIGCCESTAAINYYFLRLLIN